MSWREIVHGLPLVLDVSGETMLRFAHSFDHQTEATLRAILELLETPELSALAPLKLYLRSSNAVYALEGQVRLPQQMQTLLAQVQAKCQQGGHQLYTVRSLQSWVSLEAWLVAEYGGETWAVLVTGQVVTRPIGQAEPKVFSDREDRRIASGGTAAWLPVNPTLGSK